MGRKYVGVIRAAFLFIELFSDAAIKDWLKRILVTLYYKNE